MPQTIAAKITDGEAVLAELVTVTLTITTNPNGLKSWQGYFEFDGTFSIGGRGTYTLASDDGRKGQFVVRRSQMRPGAAQMVEFQGTGPFE